MSKILDNWRNGRGLPGVLVVDGHIHINGWRHAPTFRTAEEAAEESVAFMDANGVDLACSMGGGYMLEGEDYRLGNDFLLDVCRRIPDRLIGFAHVNPNDKQEAILDELKRVWDRGIRGIKLINDYQRYPGDGPNLMAVYEFAAEHGMLVLNHSWTNEVLAKIARAFPQVDFICGHYSSRYDPLLKAHKNVHTNIWTYGDYGWVNRGIASVGAGKFMMGSDGFLNPMSVGIGLVVYAPISDSDKRQVLGLNQARLLDKAGVLPKWIRKEHFHTRGR